MGKRKRKQKHGVDEAVDRERRPAASPICWIFAAALLVRLTHQFYFRQDFWFKTPLLDDNIFVSWADVIEREGWLAPSLGIFHLNPAYPYFLAFLGKTVGRGVHAVYLLQHIAGALVPVMFYELSRRAFGSKTALVAAVIGILYGPAIFYESRFLGEFWIYFFNLAALVGLCVARDSQKPAWGWAAAGAAVGFSTVFRPNVLFFLPGVLLWGLWSLRQDRSRIPVCATLFLLCMWLPLLPIQLRNRAVDPSRGWGLTTSSGGVNFYLGNNPQADGLNQAPSFIRYGPGHQYRDFKEEAERRSGRALGPKEVSRFWFGESLQWFRESPGKAVALAWAKVGFFWNFGEPPDNFFPSIFKRFTRIGALPLLSWGLIAPLGLMGLLWSLRRAESCGFWLLHAYVGSYFLVNVLFYILSRYRFPTSVGLIPFAAYALVRLNENIRENAGRRIMGMLLLGLLCFGFSWRNLIGEEDMGVSHYSMAVIYANQGWEDQAVEEYQKSIAADRTFKASYINLGLLQAGRGNLLEGAAALEGALPYETDPARVRLIRENIARLRVAAAKQEAPKGGR